VAYRSFGRFRQASTHLDTPPFSNRRHPGSAIAPGLRMGSPVRQFSDGGLRITLLGLQLCQGETSHHLRDAA
jgi:hypothetical protein